MAVGYHGTSETDAAAMLREGMRRDRAVSLGCPEGHICIAETPALAAMFGDVILEVDLDGLQGLNEFVGLEARVHADIPPERLRIYAEPVRASLAGHIDPGRTPEGQHPSSLARRRNAF